MAKNGMERKIYEFLDYREYLNAYYLFKKETQSGFSLRILSDRIGFKTKDFILRVMRGEKNLSAVSIPKVANGLGLSPRESEFFEAMVCFCQATDTAERDSQYERMQQILKTARFTQSQKLLAHHQYQVYSNWRHLAIRSSIGLHGFNGNFDELAQRLVPQVTAAEAKQSVVLLEQCQLISKDKQGQYHLTQSSITTGDRTSRKALMGFHQHCLKLGAAAVDDMVPSERNITGLTLGISAEGYTRIVEKLNAFRKEIAQIAEEDSHANRVYQIEFLLFPFTKKE